MAGRRSNMPSGMGARPQVPPQSRSVTANVAQRKWADRPTPSDAESMINPNPSTSTLKQFYNRYDNKAEASYNRAMQGVQDECQQKRDVMGLCRFQVLRDARAASSNPLQYVPEQYRNAFRQELEKVNFQMKLAKEPTEQEYVSRAQVLDRALTKVFGPQKPT